MSEKKTSKTTSITEMQKLAKLMRKFNIGVLKMDGVEIYMNPEVIKFDHIGMASSKDSDKTPRFEYGEPIVRKEDMEGPFPTN